MMDYKKKPGMMLVIKKMGEEMDSPNPMKRRWSDDEDEYDSEGFDYHNEGKHAAAQEMMEAMREGDTSSFKQAMENFIKMCMK